MLLEIHAGCRASQEPKEVLNRVFGEWFSLVWLIGLVWLVGLAHRWRMVVGNIARMGSERIATLSNELSQTIRALVLELVREELARERERTKPAEYLSTQEAAAFAGVHERTIRRLIESGKLTGYKIGRVHRIRRSELEKYMRDGGRRSRDAHELSPEELADRDFGGLTRRISRR